MVIATIRMNASACGVSAPAIASVIPWTMAPTGMTTLSTSSN
jgi:hypothetical protein